MSTGMRKWMEKDCPEIEYLSAQVLIDREDLDRLEAAEKERDALRALVDVLRSEISALRTKIEQMEQQEPYSYIYEYANPIDGSPVWRDTPGYWNAQYPRSSKPLYALPGAQTVPEKLCYDSRWEISIDYVDGWNAAVDMMRGKSPSWHCPDCCIAFPFGAPKSCPHDDVRCNRLLAAAPEVQP